MVDEESSKEQAQLEQIINSPKITNLDIGDADLTGIAIEKDIKQRNRKSLLSIVKPAIIIALIVVLGLGTAIVFTNYSVVNAPVVGASLNLGPISFVQKNYNPEDYLHQGATVLYDGTSPSDSFLCLTDKYSIGKVSKMNNQYVSIAGNIKDTQITTREIVFVIDGDA